MALMTTGLIRRNGGILARRSVLLTINNQSGRFNHLENRQLRLYSTENTSNEGDNAKKQQSSSPSSAKSSASWPIYVGLAGFFGTLFYQFGQQSEGAVNDNKVNNAAASPSSLLLVPFEYIQRTFKKFTGLFTKMAEPAFDSFLPDKTLMNTQDKPYTLVIDLDRFLVAHVWDPALTKWRIAKRPGADLFLFYMAQLYEIVVFSSLSQFEGDPIVKKLDPYGCVAASLYRFATEYSGGVYYKDISKLNRDMKKVLVVGHDQVGFSRNSDNFLKMDPWDGNDSSDRVLENMIDFLEAVAYAKPEDVRNVVKRYSGKRLPDEFDKVQGNLYDSIQQSQKRLAESGARSLLRRLFSFGSASTASSLQESTANTYADKKKELLALRKKEYARAKALMDEQIRIAIEKEKAYLAEQKMPFFDLATKGAPPVPPSHEPEATRSN